MANKLSLSGEFATERPAGKRYRSTAAGTGAQQQRRRSTALSSRCGQCRVDSRGTRLNTDLLHANQSIKSAQRRIHKVRMGGNARFNKWAQNFDERLHDRGPQKAPSSGDLGPT